ncbi:DUF1592 domain-containing protein [Zavarzinella formosa]|uniref:DUF1592 domain-containing protein n=1 Tax=Zavarzinella formosa TaxID=360055 RepID=UPI0003665EF0|nr:DUF1592 domain-containing protein [Zavarzinella formosa]
MNFRSLRFRYAVFAGLSLCGAMTAWLLPQHQSTTAKEPEREGLKDQYAEVVQPLVKKFCLDCHSTKAKKGSLDLERFVSLDTLRKDIKPWQQTIEMLETLEMPPKDKPQPTAGERKQLVAWIRGFLDAEARANAGDPGHVPLRRLSNAEFDLTIRDLTGVDLRPTREFPADGAGGEGFTNAAEALSDISPALLTKYLNAAKDISEHVVLLPNGFQFSPTKTRRDWTDESVARMRQFYSQFTSDGRLPVKPYLLATVRYREALTSGKITIEDVARQEKLNAKYLGILWATLTAKTDSFPLDEIRTRWARATEKDVDGLTAEITAWQTVLWKFVPVGSYRYGNTHRQVANDPPVAESQPIKLAVKPTPGQSEIVLYLVAREKSSDGKGGLAVWNRPRFEGAGKPPLLLKDYSQFGVAFEVDYPTLFTDSSKYLNAVAEAARDRKQTAEELAKKHGLDAAFLKRWIDVLALETSDRPSDPEKIGKPIPTVALELLTKKTAATDKSVINGWRFKGADLPILISNSSDTVQRIPGTMSPHRVAVHPTPKEFVAVSWKSPVTGTMRISPRISHVHPVCGNGVAWWLEHRRGDRASLVIDGVLDLGGEAKPGERALKLEKGDVLILAVDARNGDHTCDLTEINLTVTEADKPGRVWDLAADVADTVQQGNPHADKHDNKDVWSFVKGPTRPTSKTAGPIIPAGSILGRWREVAVDPAKQQEAAALADQVQKLLTGARPSKEGTPNRVVYDRLVNVEGILFTGVDPSKLGKPKSANVKYGLAKDLFGKHPANKSVDEASLIVPANSVTEVRLPAALFRDREFVVDGKRDGSAVDSLVQFQVSTTPPGPDSRWDGKSPVVASANGAARKRLIEGYADFRRCFPTFICLHEIVPNDEVVTLKMYHREDELLAQLMLNDEQKRQIDRLWSQHRFISQQPVAENKYLPLFIGFVTQDQPKELLAYFEGQRSVFRKRAEDFEKDVEAAIPAQLDSLIEFASRAYRRPLQAKEKDELLGLYQTLRKKEVSHEEAFRGVLSRVLVAPAFLFRIEQAPAGNKPGLVSNWELATRLSYFLSSSGPDEELAKLAATNRLHDPKILEEQTRRLLKDDKVRALAIEFGIQWLHVRGFDELKEKNEKLFPTFDANLRKIIYEESILFFQDLFQQDRSVHQILDSDATYLNETLAKHYGIPGVNGPQWRRVEGIQKFGRGGILGLASVQTKQSGASRTSPVLRGNWVVETLLGEKLPRPPANVPSLPEEEGTDKLTTRQQVEKHAKQAECAVCHQRIDPFGFALEKYDTIGRRRDKDLAGLAVDTHAKLKDGTEFDGLDGLRTYLMTKKKDVIVRLFCRKLLGYALGRGVTLSDQSLVDEMIAELNKNDGRLSAAVMTIVRSPQFRMIRGSDYANHE